MDNRIPNIIKEYVNKDKEDSQVNFLSFNNWLSKNDNNSSDWIVVARDEKINKFSDYYLISCLIKKEEIALKSILSKSDWYIGSSFGIPRKFQNEFEDEIYDDGLKVKHENITYLPFSFLRSFNNYVPSYFQVIEHFLLYYNCFWVKDKREYHAMGESGEINTILRHIKEDDRELILIDSHLLRDYLAVRGCCLVRFHDHRRRSKEDISAFIKGEFKTFTLNDESSFFELDLRTDIQYDEVKSTSRLLGKDLVFGYNKPKSHGWNSAVENKYLDFVIDRDENGEELNETCNPKLLSNYFTDKGKVHFLTSTFFKRELLQKYFAEPSKYQVTEHSVSYLNLWRIEISITDENLIQVYLGDLGKCLPYKEQLHWKQFNVPPKGKLPEHRFKRDFLVEFSTPSVEESPIMHFKKVFEEIQNLFKDKHGQELFKDLNINDNHLYTTLHIPLTEEWKEFDEQVLAIAKITTDSLNGKLLNKITGLKIGEKGTNGKEIKGLLALFYEYLAINIPEENEREQIITPFNKIQSIRSGSVAHRKSKSLDKTLKRYNLHELNNEAKFKNIILDLINSIQKIKKYCA